MSWLLFVPDELLLLVFAGIGIAVILRLLPIKAALSIIGLLVLFSLSGPFIEAILKSLPGWVSLVLIAFTLLSMVRGLCRLIIGREATNEMVGELAADVVRLVFKAIFLFPLYLLKGLFKLLNDRR